MATANMGLVLPVDGATDWTTTLATVFDLIDAHKHENATGVEATLQAFGRLGSSATIFSSPGATGATTHQHDEKWKLAIGANTTSLGVCVVTFPKPFLYAPMVFLQVMTMSKTATHISTFGAKPFTITATQVAVWTYHESIVDGGVVGAAVDPLLTYDPAIGPITFFWAAFGLGNQ